MFMCPQSFKWQKNDIKRGGLIYIRRRRRRTAGGSAGQTEFHLIRLIFGWRINFGGGGQIRRRSGVPQMQAAATLLSTITTNKRDKAT